MVGDAAENKVGGPIVVGRRAGMVFTFAASQLLHADRGHSSGSVYWNLAFGFERGEAVKDEEGVGEIRIFGKRLAWLAKKVNT